MYEPSIERPDGGGGRGPKLAALFGLSLVGGALAIFGVNPVYEVQPFPLFLALACGCLCVALSRTLSRAHTHRLAVAVVVFGPAAAGAGWLYAQAPQAIDRRAYTAAETALLARIAAFGGSPGRPTTEATTGATGGSASSIRQRATRPHGSTRCRRRRARRVVRFYAGQLQRAGLAVSRFRLHVPPDAEEVDGQHGPVRVSAVVEATRVQLVAQCERNGPFDPRQIEPPCPTPRR